VSGIPGDVNAFHGLIHGDAMEIDNLISNDTESTPPTGSGDRPMPPKSDHDHVKNIAMDIPEDLHNESATLLTSLDLADKIRGYRPLELTNDTESAHPTGNSDRPMPPKSDHDQVESNAMDIPEDRRNESATLASSRDPADKIRGYPPLELTNDTESTLPIGSSDMSMPPKTDRDRVENKAVDILEDRHDKSATLLPSLDLAEKIKGYRLLELISEQASNGLGECRSESPIVEGQKI
jgi:hypothetical protein